MKTLIDPEETAAAIPHQGPNVSPVGEFKLENRTGMSGAVNDKLIRCQQLARSSNSARRNLGFQNPWLSLTLGQCNNPQWD